MRTTTHSLTELWSEARKPLTQIVAGLKESDLRKRRPPCEESLGFLLRHIAEVELYYAEQVFKAKDKKVDMNTLKVKVDTGEWTDLNEIEDQLELAFDMLMTAIFYTVDTDWDKPVNVAESRTLTLAEALGMLIAHTSYHTGQLRWIQKYGE